MQIQVNAADRESRDVDADMVRAAVSDALDRFAARVTRVEVHVRDVNGPKGGHDKECTMEARLAGREPLAVRASGEDLWQAVSTAAGKLKRVVENDLERLNDSR